MNLSTKGKYALQLLTRLGMGAGSGRLVALREIAANEGLSEKYLWQVASQLKAAGLIDAAPGARGGFVLSRPPSAITLAEALVVFEPELIRSPAAERKPTASPHTLVASAVERRLKEVDSELEQILSSISVGDLVDDCRNQQSCVDFYQI